MVFECELCKKEPTSHSFFKYEESDDRIIYYGCPVKGLNKEITGIITHIKGMLDENNGKKMIIILDFKDYKITNYLEITNSIEIVKLIFNERYYSLLENIIVINNNSYVTILINAVKKCINTNILDKVIFS